MFELKPLPDDAVPGALAKGERYRLLNEPWQAESIYRDILWADSKNQEALVGLILSLTDQFREGAGPGIDPARELNQQLEGEYERAYYAGIICERWGSAQIENGVPDHVAVGWLREAMRSYEQAEASSPPGNPDAALRWNACARFIMRCEKPASRPAATGSASGPPGEIPLE